VSMADWLAPFNVPEFQDKEFEEARAKYIAKHGYTLTLPGLSDIFVIDVEKPLTEQEKYDWSRGFYGEFSPERREEIKWMKEQRKRRFLSMLASPSPNIARNIGAIMTSLDDAQDAISTLAVIGMLATQAVPRSVAKILSGPVGWGMATADMINVYAWLKCMMVRKDSGKRTMERLAYCNPWGKKAKAARARKMAGNIPIQASIIEGLQTTGEVFGMGISLGPIIGLLQDLAFAKARIMAGQNVTLNIPTPTIVKDIMEAWPATRTFKSWNEYKNRPRYSHWNNAFKKALTTIGSLCCFWQFKHETVGEDLIMMYAAGLLAHQMIQPTFQQFNPLDDFQNVRHIEIHAPVPTNVLTIEIIRESKLKIEECSNWPSNNQPWDNIEHIAVHTRMRTVENLRRFIESRKHDWYGYAAGYMAVETSLYALANLEGADQVRFDYTVPWKAITIIADHNYVIPVGQPQRKLQKLIAWLDRLEEENADVDFREIIAFCRANRITILPAGDDFFPKFYPIVEPDQPLVVPTG